MSENHQPVIQRLMRGLGAHGIMQVMQLCIRLAEVPLFLKFWGAAGYGEWLMVVAIPSALALSDGGFTKSAQREMTIRAGRGDRSGVLETFQSGWLLLCLLSSLVLIGMAGLLQVLPLHEWLHLKTVSADDLTWVVLLLGMQVLLSFQCGLLHGGFSSREGYAQGELCQVIAYALNFVCMMSMVAAGGGMLAAAAGAAAGHGIGLLCMRALLKKKAPELRFGWGHASRFEIRRLWLPSVANLAFPLGDAINIQGMRLLVGLMLGPASLAVFSALRTLSRMALQPVAAFARTIEPEMSLAYGAHNEERMRRLLLVGGQSALWFSVLLCLGFAFGGALLFNLWTGGHLAFTWAVYLPMLIAALINSLWGIPLTVACATNRHLRLSIAYIGINGLLCISIATALVSVVGAAGGALTLAITEAAMCVVVVKLALKLTGLPVSEWLEAVRAPPISRSLELARRVFQTHASV